MFPIGTPLHVLLVEPIPHGASKLFSDGSRCRRPDAIELPNPARYPEPVEAPEVLPLQHVPEPDGETETFNRTKALFMSLPI
jgi:hypothetical protein